MAGESNLEMPHSRSESCPDCATSIPIRLPETTRVVVCPKCRTMLDLTERDERPKKAKKVEPLIPMGRFGSIRGTKWAVVGLIVKTDGSRVYSWQEYLLYNPVEGFRWLVQNNGHWSFVKSTKTVPKPSVGDVEFLGVRYKRFLRGEAIVADVYGEIHWEIAIGERTKVADYVNPPVMLSMEQSDDEVIWSVGDYIESSDVKRAFQLTGSLPSKVGVAPNQPNPIAKSSKELLISWVVFFITCVVIAVTVGPGAPREVSKQIFTPGPMIGIPLKSEEFDLDGRGAKGVRAWSQLDNTWMEIDGDMVEVNTGKRHPFDLVLEMYRGVEMGEPWVEFNNDKKEKISSVPKGRYRLEFQVTSGLPLTQPYTIQVTDGEGAPSNFFVIAFLLSILPLSLGYLSHRRESARWSESDYSDDYAPFDMEEG